jgi:hypothetical protein|tara:strand:+ start:280 stop:507 length:228 start_codon:yes stop_codon:yes gene_type:complete
MEKTMTQFHNGKTEKFRVGMVVEFYREIDVVAIDGEEAAEIAEARQRYKQKVLADLGYIIGDVEILSTEKINENR